MGLINLYHSFSDGYVSAALINADRVNTNFSRLYNEINGLLDEANIENPSKVMVSDRNYSGSYIISGYHVHSNYIQLNAQNELRFADSDSDHYIAFKSPATVSSDVVFVLPSADGSAGYVLKTDGSANLSFVEISTILPSTLDLTYLLLHETTKPSATADHGKLYTKASDSNLYYLNDSGAEYVLCGVPVSTRYVSFMPRPGSGRLWVNTIATSDAAYIKNIGSEHAWSGAGTMTYITDANGVWRRMNTTTAGSPTQAYVADPQVSWATINNLLYLTRFQTGDSLSTCTIWCGFCVSTTDNTASLPNHGIAFRFVQGTDTNWQLYTKNAGGENTVDTGIAVNVDTVYEMAIWTDDAGTTIYWWVNGTSGSTSTNLPTNTTQMESFVHLWQNNSGGDKYIYFSYLYVEYNG